MDSIGFVLKSLIIGIVGGFCSGLTGIGGGSIYVPVFYYFYQMPVKHAIGTSLAVMLLPALAAFLTHLKGRQVDGRLAVIIILSGVCAAQVGARITGYLPDLAVKSVFVIVVGGLAVPMFIKEEDGPEGETCAAVPVWKLAAIGLCGGVIAGMCGVGGAILMVPLMHLYGKVPVRVCIGTVLSAVFFNASSGVLPYALAGLVDWRTGILVAVLATLTAPLGARVSMRTDRGRLRKIFAVLLVAGAFLVLARPS